MFELCSRERLIEEILMLMRRVEDLESQLDDLESQLDDVYDNMLRWRGIDRGSGDEPCKRCSGSGIAAYGSASTWRGGISGQVITSDVCDKCWGSGNAEKPWVNLRRLESHGITTK